METYFLYQPLETTKHVVFTKELLDTNIYILEHKIITTNKTKKTVVLRSEDV